MEDKEKSDISNNYEDYKYVYTGYQDYCNKHKINLEGQKEKEEKIIHDHHYEFDFDNSNEYQPDYSFNDIPKNNQVNNSNTYNNNRNYSNDFTNNTSSHNKVYSNNMVYKTNNKNDVTLVVVSLAIIFLVIIVLTTVFSIISEYTDYYDDTYIEYDNIEEHEYMLDDYFDAIIYNDVYCIDVYFLDVEEDNWTNNINEKHNNITNILGTNDIYDCYYDYENTTYDYDIDITSIESYYSALLGKKITVDDYYTFTLDIYNYNDDNITSFNIIYILIDGDWYITQ